MKALFIVLGLFGFGVAVGANAKPQPIEAAPVIVGSPPGEVAALRSEIESLRAELLAAQSKPPGTSLPPVQPVATVSRTPVATGGAVRYAFCANGSCGKSSQRQVFSQPRRRLFGRFR